MDCLSTDVLFAILRFVSLREPAWRTCKRFYALQRQLRGYARLALLLFRAQIAHRAQNNARIPVAVGNREDGCTFVWDKLRKLHWNVMNLHINDPNQVRCLVSGSAFSSPANPADSTPIDQFLHRVRQLSVPTRGCQVAAYVDLLWSTCDGLTCAAHEDVLSPPPRRDEDTFYLVLYVDKGIVASYILNNLKDVDGVRCQLYPKDPEQRGGAWLSISPTKVARCYAQDPRARDKIESCLVTLKSMWVNACLKYRGWAATRQT